MKFTCAQKWLLNEAGRSDGFRIDINKMRELMKENIPVLEIAKQLGSTKVGINAAIRRAFKNDLIPRDEINKYREYQKGQARQNMRELLTKRNKSEKQRGIVRNNWKNPEYRERMISRTKQLWDDPEFREKIAAAHGAWFQDPENAEYVNQLRSAAQKRPENVKRVIARNKARWEDPEFREKETARLAGLWDNPEYREKHKQRMLKRWEDTPFDEWIQQFPPEKQRQIIQAIFSKDNYEAI